MHYKNGREAKVGDQVVGRDYNGGVVSGVIVSANAQSDSCNIYIVPATNPQCYTAGNFLHADDALPPEAPPAS